MEPAHALAELLVAAPQVQAATVFGRHNERLGSVGISGSVTAAIGAGRALLAGAAEFRGVGEATQIHATLGGGDVFVVAEHGGRAILAVTSAGQPAGLVFHDLKRCLASIAGVQE